MVLSVIRLLTFVIWGVAPSAPKVARVSTTVVVPTVPAAAAASGDRGQAATFNKVSFFILLRISL